MINPQFGLNSPLWRAFKTSGMESSCASAVISSCAFIAYGKRLDLVVVRARFDVLWRPLWWKRQVVDVFHLCLSIERPCQASHTHQAAGTRLR